MMIVMTHQQQLKADGLPKHFAMLQQTSQAQTFSRQSHASSVVSGFYKCHAFVSGRILNRETPA